MVFAIHWQLCIFLQLSFLTKISLWKHHWPRVMISSFCTFCPLGQEDLPGAGLTSEGTCLFETYSGHLRVTRSGRRGSSQALSVSSPYLIKIMDVGDPLKCHVIIKCLVTNFQWAWSRYLGKLSHQMFSASISGNLYLQAPRWCADLIRAWHFLYICHVNTWSVSTQGCISSTWWGLFQWGWRKFWRSIFSRWKLQIAWYDA